MNTITAFLYPCLLLAVPTIAQRCTPSPIMGPGPLYSELRPHVADGVICAPSDISPVNETKVATSIFTRVIRHGNNQLTISGKILDEDCSPVAGAHIDVWQTTPSGVYPSIVKPTKKGDCRGYMYSQSDGAFEIHTQLPGSYGLQFGSYGPIPGFDLPLWGARHIHLAIQAPGYVLLTTELQFDDDVIVGQDFRTKLEERPDAIYISGQDAEVTLDLVLTKAATAVEQELSLKNVAEQIYSKYCDGQMFDIPQPHAVCRPKVLKYFDPIFGIACVFLAVYLGLLSAVLFVLFKITSRVYHRDLSKTKKD